MLYVRIEPVVLDDDDNGICESQTPAAGGVQSLSLDGALVTGGVAVIAAAQIITATWAGADVARTLTVTFVNVDGNTETGTIAGGSSTTTTSTFFAKSISSITIDDDTAGALEVGVVAADGSTSKSIVDNWKQSPFNMSLFVEEVVDGGTISAQYTPDDPEGTYTNSFGTDASWTNVVGLTAVVVTDDSNIAFPVRAVRFLQTVGSATATFRGTVIQGQNG